MNPFRQNNPLARPQFVDALLIVLIVLMTFWYKLLKANPGGISSLF